MRGINDDEIVPLARLATEHPWHVRFIELMPVGDMADTGFEHVVPATRSSRSRVKRSVYFFPTWVPRSATGRRGTIAHLAHPGRSA